MVHQLHSNDAFAQILRSGTCVGVVTAGVGLIEVTVVLIEEVEIDTPPAGGIRSSGQDSHSSHATMTPGRGV